jgi:vacuolar-type H+-ATPase subunit I/STV1
MGKPLTMENQEKTEINELKELISQIGNNVNSLTNNVTSLTEEVKKPRVPQSVELDLLNLKDNISKLEDFSIETRFAAVMSSSSLGLALTQYKRVLVDIFAAKQSLGDVEAQLIDEHSANEELLRERARLSESTRQINKYMEMSLQNYRAVAENNITLTGQLREQKLQLEAKQLIINNTEQLLTTIQDLTSGKDTPADVIAALKMIADELPKSLKSTELPSPPDAVLETAPPEEPPLPGEET